MLLIIINLSTGHCGKELLLISVCMAKGEAEPIAHLQLYRGANGEIFTICPPGDPLHG